MTMAIAATLVSVYAPLAQAAAPARVFVSAFGADANDCSLPRPCRTFQHAHDVVAAGGEIDVLDPAGYGSVGISKSITIQGHGFSGITVTGGDAISIIAPETANVNLSGQLIEGSNAGQFGIAVTTVGSLTITNSTVRWLCGRHRYRPKECLTGTQRQRLEYGRDPQRTWIDSSAELNQHTVGICHL